MGAVFFLSREWIASLFYSLDMWARKAGRFDDESR